MVKVIYGDAGHGWATIGVASRLLAGLMDAELVVVPIEDALGRLGRLGQLAAIAPRRHGREDCLVIAPNPGGLRALASAHQLLRGYRHVACWVIDSFWDDRIPAVAKSSQFDQFFVTDRESSSCLGGSRRSINAIARRTGWYLSIDDLPLDESRCRPEDWTPDRFGAGGRTPA